MKFQSHIRCSILKQIFSDSQVIIDFRRFFLFLVFRRDSSDAETIDIRIPIRMAVLRRLTDTARAIKENERARKLADQTVTVLRRLMALRRVQNERVAYQRAMQQWYRRNMMLNRIRHMRQVRMQRMMEAARARRAQQIAYSASARRVTGGDDAATQRPSDDRDQSDRGTRAPVAPPAGMPPGPWRYVTNGPRRQYGAARFMPFRWRARFPFAGYPMKVYRASPTLMRGPQPTGVSESITDRFIPTPGTPLVMPSSPYSQSTGMMYAPEASYLDPPQNTTLPFPAAQWSTLTTPRFAYQTRDIDPGPPFNRNNHATRTNTLVNAATSFKENSSVRLAPDTRGLMARVELPPPRGQAISFQQSEAVKGKTSSAFKPTLNHPSVVASHYDVREPDYEETFVESNENNSSALQKHVGVTNLHRSVAKSSETFDDLVSSYSLGMCDSMEAVSQSFSQQARQRTDCRMQSTPFDSSSHRRNSGMLFEPSEVRIRTVAHSGHCTGDDKLYSNQTSLSRQYRQSVSTRQSSSMIDEPKTELLQRYSFDSELPVVTNSDNRLNGDQSTTGNERRVSHQIQSNKSQHSHTLLTEKTALLSARCDVPRDEQSSSCRYASNNSMCVETRRATASMSGDGCRFSIERENAAVAQGGRHRSHNSSVSRKLQNDATVKKQPVKNDDSQRTISRRHRHR